ncbi:hypothetical protein CH296_00495 [Rhodococcus sp. 14-2496-1d]|uniref:hypothetical protein n=1 Tax=Rhodococcus sp. 14-2496-1d TaxID=2023146 RepID=UPI000B9A3B4F|nr:hypothetical protein [Rhodococcus sp. 14-2496-1d]OZF40769.1 hypothetical protein CH296_00495 [Rhodococcus sp. 14-2496-1d]
MTEIRLRHRDYADAIPIGEVAFDQVDTVIPMLTKWGLNVSGEGFVDTGDLSGTFTIEHDTGIGYFEVVIDGEVL